MNQMKSAFIKLALDCQVLKFGEFTLKSGRTSPYFFNAGLFYQGEALRQLGQFYAKTLIEHQACFDHLFGPAYKGLPLATATAIALAELGKDTTVTFNRKEVKDHGEGGQLIGAPLTGKTIIVDDVITAGTAFRESQALIKENGGQLTGVIIALDRCERGLTQESTLTEIKSQGIEVYSIITLFDLIDYLKSMNQNEQVIKLEDYQAEYGC
ncbi:orotate phosphoribosyltransferase [Fluoribacter dumoffii]|uniref:Orotate phosphoribosyltransferase n=1 Tax=Fluoribacter dumoffii TaxID=463 RepID=A0A377GB23_9GAMM|nr:orotate phosphoribosyltransferase [Fluoribacter dumoffii]KTC88822.1 orotate phosphoribosyltransferase [Fluoribacter dumoffii NY 23]MCW8385882.1 orotate phosphoribosyltransferase [Fluoribacter dumoffii]MCW8418936.1 orotate phosphoribosyltransferase [Fluoribacter dumoffii]MCW8453220.1 orotate phosphoribosyltransferase [Fluoribacter dumoffii]MCW8459559.1 orotate phosphoribosyltransferase [Fluoribacter dumoffii]